MTPLEISAPPISPISKGAEAKRQKALAALQKLPPFSPVLNKLLASLTGEYVSFANLGEVIEKDTVVAGNILRLVNSAMYARQVEVNSVRHALSVLGVDKVRNTVLAMSISRTLNQTKPPIGWSMQAFNLHSSAVAVFSDQIAQHAAVEYPEGAFVAGLFHDLGRLLIALGLPSEFDEIRALYHRGNQTWIDCEQEVLGFTHPSLSEDTLRAWNLPAPVLKAVRDHHNLPAAEAGAPLVQSGQPIPLTSVIGIANHYVNSIGETIMPNPLEAEANTEWVTSLGLTPEVMDRMLAAFETEHATLAQFYR